MSNRFALAILLAGSCAAWGCASGGDATDPGAGDVTDEREAFAWPDVGGDTPDVAADLAGHDARDAGDTGFPATLPLGCKVDGDCVTACGSGPCTDGRCVLKAGPGLCVVAGDAADQAVCYAAGQFRADAPCLRCTPAVDSTRLGPTVARESFDESPIALPPTVKDLCGGGVIWNVSTGRSYDGTSSLYFGNPATKTYAKGVRVASTAEFPGIALPAGVSPRLSFYLYLDTEQTAGYDVLTVTAASGAQATELFRSDSIGGTTGGAFQRIDLDLAAFAGRTVVVTFAFDSTDGGMNSFEGAYVDDLVLSTGCCAADADCDDGNPCTDDACAGPGLGCTHQAHADCCARDADCDDGDPCTIDRCPVPGQGCVFQEAKNCCVADADCDDHDDCTQDVCPAAGGACVHRALCCKAAADCVSGDPCFVGACTGGACTYQDTCCHSDADCNDKDPCTLDVCDAGSCGHKPANIPGCCFPTVFSADFDAGSEGFTATAATDGIGWSVVSGQQSKSAPGSLYYGDPVELVFEKGAGNQGDVTSPTFLLMSDNQITLSFWVWNNTSSDYYAYTTFQASLLSGDQEYPVWTMGWSVPDQAWSQAVVDVSAFAGREVALKFSMVVEYYDYGPYYGKPPNAIPGVAPLASSAAGQGVYVDAILFTSACAPKKCTKASDCASLDGCLTGLCQDGTCGWTNSCCAADGECDDGNVCTGDSCVSQHCQFKPVAGCCQTAFDCNDNNACTEDVCPSIGGQCQNPAIPGCCLGAGDCDDGDKCTKDLCVAHACTHSNMCCKNDADCDDGDDKCTLDACVNDFCQHTQTGAEGCCASVPFSTSFEGGDAAGWALDAPVGGVGWNVFNGGKASTGTWSLYYGNPAKLDFDNGSSNQGSALSPAITLPAGFGAALEFHAWMNTESSGSYDVLSVSWKDDTGEYALWSKGYSFVQQTWNTQKVNLSAFAGRTGSLLFHFQTNDALSNGTEGTYVDDVQVTSTCAPVTCSADADCADGLGTTKDTCSGGQCAYEVGVAPECEYDYDCDDYDYCTTDTCVAGECVFTLDPYCY